MFRPGPPADERALPPRFRFGDLAVDVPAARLYRDGVPVALEPRAFDVLLLLAANPGRVVPKEELFARLWGTSFVTDNALTRVVAHLRQQLGDRVESPAVIETVRTRGYRFLPAIVALDGAGAAAAGPPDGVLPAPPGATIATASPKAVGSASAAGASPADRRADTPAALAETVARPPFDTPAPAEPRHGEVVVSRLRGLGPWFLAGALLATAAVWAYSRWSRPAGGDASTRAGGAAAAPAIQRTVEAGVQLYPDYSPDGSQMAYAADTADGLEVFVRAVDGGRPLQLTADGPNSEPAWSPDGRWIAYRNFRRGGIWLVAPTGGEPRQLTDFGTQPAWSPDSSTLVVSHPGKATMGALEWPATYDSSLFLVDAANGDSRPLTRPDPEAGGQGMPAFTADGRWIVYATAKLFGGGGVWRVPAAGGDPEPVVRPTGRLEKGRAFWFDPTPLPDGSGLYVSRIADDDRIVRLGWPDGAERETLIAPGTAGIGHLALRRDGRQLAFVVERAESSVEEVPVRPDGEVTGPPRTLLAPAVRRVGRPRYSPDGRLLLVIRQRTGLAPEIVVLDRDGRELRVLEAVRHAMWTSPTVAVGLFQDGHLRRVDVTTGRDQPAPPAAWMERALVLGAPRAVETRSDLRAIALTLQTGDGRELAVIEEGQMEPRTLTHLGGLIDFPFWSPEGDWIVFQLARRTGLDNELWGISPAGGEPRQYRTGKGPSWGGAFSPNRELVLYAAFRAGRWHLAVAGTDTDERLLAVAPETRGYLRWPDWSRDGTHIAYERMRTHANIWTADLSPAR